MLCTKQPIMRYDPDYDILDYIIDPDAEAYGDEETDNIVVFRDFETEEVTSYKIIGFGKICKEKGTAFSQLQKLFDADSAKSLVLIE